MTIYVFALLWVVLYVFALWLGLAAVVKKASHHWRILVYVPYVVAVLPSILRLATVDDALDSLLLAILLLALTAILLAIGRKEWLSSE